LEEVGPVRKVKLNLDIRDGAVLGSIGTADVYFKEERDARRAAELFHNVEFDGDILHICFLFIHTYSLNGNSGKRMKVYYCGIAGTSRQGKASKKKLKKSSKRDKVDFH
jgi:hypothetical protein